MKKILYLTLLTCISVNFAFAQLNYDFGIDEIHINEFPNIDKMPFAVAGVLTNHGTVDIISFTINYSINGGPAVASPFSFTNVIAGSSFEYSSSVAWNPAAAGNYNVKVWASDLNGNVDQNHSNDTMEIDIVMSDSIPNIVDGFLSTIPLYTVIGTVVDGLDSPRDLDFHPDLSRMELWVINEKTEASGGSTITYHDAGLPTMNEINLQDGNAWHFMSLPSGMAFSDNGNWCSSPGVYDANHNGGAPFTGPTLWSGDLNIYAQPSGGNGSHLDMLHESPHSMGVACEKDNVFWIFDSQNGDIVRYDFVDDHGPGNSYHDDGIVRRYPVPVSRINLDIPCHLVYDDKTDWLYIVNGGNAEILRLDVTSGVPNGMPVAPQYETLAEYTQMDSVVVETVVSTGLIEPAGIEVIGDRMLVSDHSNGDILIYNISNIPATLMGVIPTGVAGIQGIKIGPEGFIWYVNAITNEVVKVEQGAVSVTEIINSNDISVFPNPSTDQVNIRSSNLDLAGFTLEVSDMIGKVKYQSVELSGLQESIDVSAFAAGVYSLTLYKEGQTSITKKIIVN